MCLINIVFHLCNIYISENLFIQLISVFDCPGKYNGVKRMESLDINNPSDTINWWSKDPMKENSDIYYHIDDQPFVKVSNYFFFLNCLQLLFLQNL